MPDFNAKDKTQIYDNATEIRLNQQRIEVLQREITVFRSELSQQLNSNQDNTILRIEKMLSDEYRNNQRWKNTTIVGLIIALTVEFISNMFFL